MTRSLAGTISSASGDRGALGQPVAAVPCRAERPGGTAGTRASVPSTACTHLSGTSANLPPRAVGILAAEEDLPLTTVTLLHPVHHPAAVGRGGQEVLRDPLVGEATSQVNAVRCAAELAEPHLLPEARRDRRSGCTRTLNCRDARPPIRPSDSRGGSARRRPPRSRRRRRAATRPRVPCSDSETATRRPSGDGTNKSMVVSPDGSMASGSTTTRSVAVSSRSVSATRNGCCRGVCSFSAKKVLPPDTRAPCTSSSRPSAAARHGPAARPATGSPSKWARVQLPLGVRPGDGLR